MLFGRVYFSLSAAQRADRGPELAAHGVVDEEVARGVDRGAQQCNTDHERERVEVATTQAEIRD